MWTKQNIAKIKKKKKLLSFSKDCVRDAYHENCCVEAE